MFHLQYQVREVTGQGPEVELSTHIVPIVIVNWYTLYIGMYPFMWLFTCFTADFVHEKCINFWITDSLLASSEILVDSNHARLTNNKWLNLESSKSSIPRSRFPFGSVANWVLFIWYQRWKVSQNCTHKSFIYNSSKAIMASCSEKSKCQSRCQGTRGSCHLFDAWCLLS